MHWSIQLLIFRREFHLLSNESILLFQILICECVDRSNYRSSDGNSIRLMLLFHQFDQSNRVALINISNQCFHCNLINFNLSILSYFQSILRGTLFERSNQYHPIDFIRRWSFQFIVNVAERCALPIYWSFQPINLCAFIWQWFHSTMVSV